nr:Arm DNA-binding domain-containing protein [Bartonella elizabethae]
MLLQKRKEGGAQWINLYTLYWCRCEMGLSILKDISLKQAHELATQWRSILHQGHDPILRIRTILSWDE